MAQQFQVTVLGASNLPPQASGPPTAFATVNIVDAGQQIPDDPMQTQSPSGLRTGSVPKNPNPTWQAVLPFRQQLQDGAKAVITVWHMEPQGMCTKIGRVTIPLPPTVNSAIKQNLEDDSGVVIQGAGGGYAPITVQVTMPGQQPPNPNQFVNKPMTPGPTGRSARLTESQLERRGYTSDQIKRTLQKQREALAAEEKNLKADINDELLRMAEAEESNPYKGVRDIPPPMPASRHIDDLFMEPAGRPVGPIGPSAILDGIPIWSENEYDPFNGMIGRSAPLRPAMQPYMDIIETGPPIDLPMFDTGMPPMGGTGYVMEELRQPYMPQPQVVRVPAPPQYAPQQFEFAPQQQYAPPPRVIQRPPMMVGPPPQAPIIRVTQRPPVQGPMVTMPPPGPPVMHPGQMQMGPPPTIMAGQPPMMPMGMGGPPMMGGLQPMMGGQPPMMGGQPPMMGGQQPMMMGGPQPPFLRPYDDYDLSGENF